MNLEARKISLVQEFLNINNEKIIAVLENFIIRSKSINFDENFEPMTMEKFNTEIDLALEDEKNNRIIAAIDLKAQIQEWN
ncbi:hypothetical protein [Frigoriflavimonas asaccharolytica]|uniref:Uncharacterized protein n=1 Tax=Frigoriflavimonas asaccharolytica TaxID=2735899 RepID=A0A8J8G4U3_9FLAO|nr:hypothetical protein [Frigoriflavimonas asaccharolytica]NRS91316.1 hypothetical protein [Frigoriflavimonas asaccharolytica]